MWAERSRMWRLGWAVFVLGAVGLRGASLCAADDPPTTAAAAPAAGAAADREASTAPATAAGDADYLSPESRRERLVNHLTSEYAHVLQSRLWMDRALGLMCLSRVPGDKPTAMLMEALRTDSLPMVRMVAWHGMVSRVKGLSAAQWADFCNVTWNLAGQGFFRGEMRVSLLRWLEVQPADARARGVWKQLFAECSTMPTVVDSSDAAVLAGLARCLTTWHDAELTEYVIGRMAVLNDVFRAELVLRRAAGMDPGPVRFQMGWVQTGRGTSTPGGTGAVAAGRLPRRATAWWDLGSRDMMRNAAAEYAAWWRQEQAKPAAPRGVAGARTSDADWRGLTSPYLPPMPLAAVSEMDPDDPQWRRDLELGDPQIPSLNIGFVVDATGSMGRPMRLLRAELKRMMEALALVTREPGIGVTCYRDHGDEFVARTIAPLAGPGGMENLLAAFGKVTAKGGGDEPEAVLEGLQECLRNGHWPAVRDAAPVGGGRPGTRPAGRAATGAAKRVLILIGDAPPHPEDEAACEQLVAQQAAKGFKLYAVKAVTGYEAEDLSAFDTLAGLGGGKVFVVTAPDVLPRMTARGQAQATWAEDAWQADQQRRARGEVEEGLAPALSTVLAEAINPQYADRVAPLARVLLAGLTKNSPLEVQRPWDKVVLPPVMPHPPTAPVPARPVLPRGPQDQ